MGVSFGTMKRQVALVLALLGISGLTNGVSLQRSAKGPDHAAAESRSMDWLNDMAEWIEGTDDEIADIVEDVEEIDGDVMDLVSNISNLYEMGYDMGDMIEDNADDINNQKENIGGLIEDVIDALDNMGSFESGSGSDESGGDSGSGSGGDSGSGSGGDSGSDSGETTTVASSTWASSTTEGPDYPDCKQEVHDDLYCDGC